MLLLGRRGAAKAQTADTSFPRWKNDKKTRRALQRTRFFEDSSREAGFDHTRYVQWGTGLADLDNDGWPDILTVTDNVYPEVEKYFKEYSHRSIRLVYRNLGNGRFRDVSALCGPGVMTPHSTRGCAFGDFDNDCDIDVLVMNMNEPPSLLRNEYINNTGGGGNNWLKLKLIGTKSNRSAIGARVRLRTAAHLQSQEYLTFFC